MALYHQRRRFSSLMSNFIMLTHWMSSITRFDRQIYCCYFAPTYYKIFSLEQWLCIAVTVVNCWFFIYCCCQLSDNCNGTFDHYFHLDYVSVIYSSFIFPVKWYFITATMVYSFFCFIPLLSLPGWVWPKMLTTDSMINNLCSYTLHCFSQHKCALSLLRWFIIVVVFFIIITISMIDTTCFNCPFHQKNFTVTDSRIIFPVQ